MNVIDAMIDLGMEAWLGKPYRWKDVGDYLGKTDNAARKQYRRFTQRAAREGVPVETLATKNRYDESIGDAMSPETLLQRVPGTGDLELTGGRLSVWTQGDKVNYSVRAQVKPKQLPPEDFVAAIVAGVNAAVIPTPNAKDRTSEPLSAVISLYDVHVEEKDTIPVEYILGELEKYLAPYRAQITEVIIPIGNDLGNFDNMGGLTTSGTPQENRMSIADGVAARVSLVTSVIDYLITNYGRVTIPLVPGNHDRFSTIWLGHALSQRYRDIPSVTVMHSQYRQYVSSGGNGFMFYHGEIKYDPVPIFATEAPEIYAKANHREIHTGHVHKLGTTYQPVTDKYGVIRRFMPSLAEGGEWNRLMGFGSTRGFQVNLYKLKGGVKCMTIL